jgi:hypothetical protein
MPIIAGLLGWSLAALMLPNPITVAEPAFSERTATTSG